ncbi:Thyrotropin-releasing hormone-degrading ectoenzyme, partial [Orchesella cincta]
FRLNEGFARYLQFIGANFSGGDFRSLDRYVIDVTQLAMAYDELDTTEPVHSNITHRVVDQASRVVYEKAAGLIRMMQSFLTEETLIKGLRTYLKRHQFSGVTQDDLFKALTEQAEADDTFTEYTVKEIMDTWTLQSGFPIVQVSVADSQTLYISQERYRPDPMSRNSSELWYVPISFVTAANPDFSASNSRPKAWIDKNTLLQTLTIDSTNEWIIINPDARGFYRVIYDDHLTGLIQEQLLKDHEVISFGSRSQLLDDYFRSASAKYVNIQHALSLTRYLSQENDFIVWTTVVNNLAPLYTRLADTDAYEAFRDYVLSLVVEPLQRIGSNQLPTDSTPIAVLRTQLLDWVCSLSHEICSQTADQLFSAWLSASPQDKVPVPTDIQPMIYCGAVTASNDPTNTTIQDFLLEEYARNRDARQQTLIVNALACDQVEANLEKLLEKAVDNSTGNELNVGAHGLQLLQSIARNSAGRQLIWDFVVNNQSDITAMHGVMAVPNIISSLVGYLSPKSTTTLPQQVETFINTYLSQPDVPTQVRNSLQTSLSTLSNNGAWMDYHYNDVNSWLTGL